MGDLSLPWVVVVLGLTLTWRLTVAELKRIEDRDAERFGKLCTDFGRSVEEEIRRYAQALMGMRDWYSGEPAMSEAAWANHVYTLHLPAHYPALFNVGFAELVMDTDVPPLKPNLDRHLALMRERFGPSYSITLPPGRSQPYTWYQMPVVWHSFGQRRIDPVRPYLHYGMDLNQDPDLWAAMNWAIGQDVPALSGRQSLDPEHPAVAGFMVFLPVYAKSFRHEVNHEPVSRIYPNPTTKQEVEEAERVARVLTWQQSTRGLIFGGIDMQTLLQRHLGTNAPAIALACHGSTNLSATASAEQLVFDNRSATRTTPANFHVSRVVDLFGRSILLSMEPGPGFKRGEARRALMWAAGVGVVATLLLAYFISYQGRAYRKERGISEALRQSQAQLQSLLHDRSRISRDLHDGTIQSLYAIGLGLSQLRRTLDQPEQSARLGGSLAELDHVITELRGYLEELDPGVSPAQSPKKALVELITRLGQATATELQLEVAPDIGESWPPAVVLDLLQMTREGISNALRHGEATQVGIGLKRCGESQVSLILSDNGKGFDPERKEDRGHGLANLELRARVWGGSMQVDSRMGGPTRLVITFTPGDPLKHGGNV